MTRPSRLFEDLRATPRWSPDGARFQCADDSERVVASLDLHGGRTLATIALAKNAKQSGLKRGGYVNAHRQLHGFRETVAELVRLERIVEEGDVTGLPTRKRRTLHWPRTAFPTRTLAFLRRRARWRWQWASISRRGAPDIVEPRTWRAVAWCCVLLDDDVQMEVGVQLYPARSKKRPSNAALANATRLLRRALRPFGYRSLKMIGPNAPKLVMMEKTVKTLAEARRERRRIDRLIFGAV